MLLTPPPGQATRALVSLLPVPPVRHRWSLYCSFHRVPLVPGQNGYHVLHQQAVSWIKPERAPRAAAEAECAHRVEGSASALVRITTPLTIMVGGAKRENRQRNRLGCVSPKEQSSDGVWQCKHLLLYYGFSNLDADFISGPSTRLGYDFLPSCRSDSCDDAYSMR